MSKFSKLLEEKEFLLLDGATGTQLFAAGLESGWPPEEWNVSHPDKIIEMHKSYVEAGSDLILTNSFGGSSYRLKLHKFDDRVYEFNKAASENARKAADSDASEGRTVLVAGSIGPSGELLVPMGNMTFEAAVSAFAEQAKGLIDGGADLLWIETMSDLDEVRAAYEGARLIDAKIPICATMSFDTSCKTMMGISGIKAANEMAAMGLAAIGANCGNTLPDTELVLAQIRTTNQDIPIIGKPNAGIPEWRGEDLVYDGTPNLMANHAYRMRAMGVSLIGGCCGSSPEHIRRMRSVLDGELAVPRANLAAPASDDKPSIKEKNARVRKRRRRS